MNKELLKGLTEEQIAKVEACKSSEELLKLAKEEGVVLTDEQLAAVNGGGCASTIKCPKCGHDKYYKEQQIHKMDGSPVWFYVCKKCGFKWL